MAEMFSECSFLIDIDISDFTFFGARNVYSMFYGCKDNLKICVTQSIRKNSNKIVQKEMITAEIIKNKE